MLVKQIKDKLVLTWEKGDDIKVGETVTVDIPKSVTDYGNEKTGEIYRTKKEILGAFAGCIVSQSPFIPKNLAEILGYVDVSLSTWEDQELNVLHFKNDEIFQFVIHKIVFGDALMTDLNKSYAEKDGKKVPEIMFTSRYDQPKPEYDFVDLDALERNVLSMLSQ